MHKFNLDGLAEVIEKLQGKPVYITLGSGCAGSVCISGNRNSGGGRCHICGTDECCDPDSTGVNVVGCDVNELSPVYDPSGVSTAVAGKIIREFLLALQV